LLKKQGDAFEAFKTANDQRLAEIEKEGKASADTLKTISDLNDTINKVTGELKSANERMDDIEKKGNRFAAGDVDVVQRQETLMKKKEFWAIVSNTPMAQPFFESMIKDAFPNEAPQLLADMKVAAQQQALISGLGTALAGMAQTFAGSISPEQQQQLMQLVTAAQSSVQQGQPASSSQQPKAQPQ